MTAAPALFALGLVVILIASLFVATPLFRPVRPAAPDDDGSERARWERQKRQALAAIREAEMDHRMGKLSDEDFTTTDRELRAQAVEILRELEDVDAGTEVRR